MGVSNPWSSEFAGFGVSLAKLKIAELFVWCLTRQSTLISASGYMHCKIRCLDSTFSLLFFSEQGFRSVNRIVISERWMILHVQSCAHAVTATHLVMGELCEKTRWKQKSHGDHKEIGYGLESGPAGLPISSNILKYRTSKNMKRTQRRTKPIVQFLLLRKLTCHLKIGLPKRKLVFQPPIFQGLC